MGGKGGGGGNSTPFDPKATAQSYYDANPTGKDDNTYGYVQSYKNQYEQNRANYRDPTTGAYDQSAWFKAKGGAGMDWSKDLFDLYYPTDPSAAAAAPAPAAAVAPAPAAAVATPDATPAAATDTTTGTPIDTGAAITQPDSAANLLGGSVLNPPKYWVGDQNAYTSARKTAGNITTTQT